MTEIKDQINFEIDSEQVNVTDDGIQSISVLAETQVDLENQIEEKENEMKDFLSALAVHAIFAIALIWLILKITG